MLVGKETFKPKDNKNPCFYHPNITNVKISVCIYLFRFQSHVST